MKRLLLIVSAAALLTVGQAAAQDAGTTAPDSAERAGITVPAGDPQPAVMADTTVTTTAPMSEWREQPPLPPQGDSPRQGLGWHWLADLLMLAAAGGAWAVALINRRELTQLKRTVADHADTTTRNLEKLVQETDARLKAMKSIDRTKPSTAHEPAKPVASAPSRSQAVNKPAEPQVLYLARANENGHFVRASENFELGNSIFVLHVTDGRHGVFRVMDNRDVHRYALMMPTENLTRACTGHNIQLSGGFTRIVNDQDGEAELDTTRGMWRVVKQAAIHYE